MFSRRKFLKSAALTLISSPFLSADSIDGRLTEFSKLGRSLQNVLKEISLDKNAQINLITRFMGGNKFTGEFPVVRSELLENTKALKTDPKTLLFFGQITDTHILDEESPARLVAAEPYLEALGVRSAFHPQEDLALQVLDSMIRTLNDVSRISTFDFLLNTGDSIDNTQELELQWFLKVLEGEMVDPDSGTNENPGPGLNDDGNDPFLPEGLLKNIPIYSAIGNHDILFQGNIPIYLREIYNAIVKKYLKFMKLYAPQGNQSNAIVTPWIIPPNPKDLKPGEIIADARRRAITPKEYIAMHTNFSTQRPCLGFPQKLSGKDVGYYVTYPNPKMPIKMIVLDTASRIGSSMGMLGETQYKDFLIPELEKAKKNKELVIVASHHPTKSLFSLEKAKQKLLDRFSRNEALKKMIEELVKTMEPKETQISRADLQSTISKYPNVMMHVAGHTHRNKIRQVGEGEHGYWEVETASLLSYPQQSRLFEIVYEGNGIGAIHTFVVDHKSTANTLADRSRKLAEKDHKVDTKKEDKNAVLRFQIPSEIEKKL